MKATPKKTPKPRKPSAAHRITDELLYYIADYEAVLAYIRAAERMRRVSHWPSGRGVAAVAYDRAKKAVLGAE